MQFSLNSFCSFFKSSDRIVLYVSVDSEASFLQPFLPVFKECKFMPKLSDILEIDEKLPGENSKKKQKVECNMCKGSGFHLYEKIVDNGVQKLSYTFLARCECQNGLEYAYDGTKISDARYRSKYYIPTIQQLGI